MLGAVSYTRRAGIDIGSHPRDIDGARSAKSHCDLGTDRLIELVEIDLAPGFPEASTWKSLRLSVPGVAPVTLTVTCGDSSGVVLGASKYRDFRG